MQKAQFKLYRTNGTEAGRATFFGKSWKAAKAAGERYLHKLNIRRNVAAGFRDSEGVFHPIRASGDYDPVRTGEAGRPRPYGTKRPLTKKSQKAFLSRRTSRKKARRRR